MRRLLTMLAASLFLEAGARIKPSTLGRREAELMAISMLDQMLFDLSCGHDVVLGRLANFKTWSWKRTELSAGVYQAKLEHDLDTANQIDLQAKQRGETIERIG